MQTYLGDEAAVPFSPTNIEPESVFDLRPPHIPTTSNAVLDDSLSAIIGYRTESVAGVYRYYDLDGSVVGIEEKPLETPLIDPLDLIFLFGGVLRIVGKELFVNGVARMTPRIAAQTAVELSARTFGTAAVAAMRVAFKGLAVRNLKFTATTAARMATKGRHVPIHILHLALKYGKRIPDPQGLKGAFLYTAKMLRNGKQYTLEVVVRENDWTILHFLYK